MPDQFSLEYFEPPVELSRHILTLFHFVWNEQEMRDRQPGALSQIALFIDGEAEAEFDHASQGPVTDSVLIGAFSKAVPYRVKGPWRAVGASLSPFGWAALTGRPLNKSLDRIYPAEHILGPEIAQFAQEIRTDYRAGSLSGKAACDRLADWIAPRLETIKPPHEGLIETAVKWLGSSLKPEVDDLFGQSQYSRRQTERLVERYFGVPPAALARKFRAVRASSLLAQEDLSDKAEAEIAEAFHDQPHMIREIRRYCGYTPSRLGGTNEPLFHTMLRLKNMDRLAQTRGLA